MFTIILLLSLLSAAADAGRQSGSVFGIITDTTGEGLPGARIVVSAADGSRHEATASTLGRYKIDALPPGRYRIEAGMGGFETKVSAIAVAANETAIWSGALLLGGSVVGEASIERRVMQETGWDAVDCGRHATPAEARHLDKSLAPATTSVPHFR